jgi:hypothetical protein
MAGVRSRHDRARSRGAAERVRPGRGNQGREAGNALAKPTGKQSSEDIMLKTIGVALGALLLAAGPALADGRHTPASLAGAATSSQDQNTVVVPAQSTTDETYTTMNTELLVSGAVLFGAGYGAGAIAASQSDRAGMDRLYVPLIGPWLALNDRGACPVTNNSCDNETTAKVLIVGDGIIQAAGAFMMLDAALFPKTVHRTIPEAALRVKPIRVGNDGRGLAYTGHF